MNFKPDDFSQDQSSLYSADATNVARVQARWKALQVGDLRQAMAAALSETPGPTLVAGPKDTDEVLGYHYHNMNKGEKTKNFDQKVYMFPPAFNALRRELHDNWAELWELCSYRMAFLPEEFAQLMNDATELRVVFDSGAVNWMCEKWLNKLIALRMKATGG